MSHDREATMGGRDWLNGPTLDYANRAIGIAPVRYVTPQTPSPQLTRPQILPGSGWPRNLRRPAPTDRRGNDGPRRSTEP